MPTGVGRRFRVVASACALVAAACTGTSADDVPRLSPFTGLRWKGDVPEARVQDEWYRVVAIDGVPVEDILAHAKTAHGGRWQRRFAEDLVQLLTEMGRAPGPAVSLDLVHLASGEAVRLDAVKMTRKNRQALLEARRRAEEKVRPSGDRWDARLTGAQVASDIAVLTRALEERYSYLALAERRGCDWRKGLADLSAKAGRGMTRRVLAVELAKVLARFGDGHTRVRGRYDWLPAGFLLLVLEDLDGKLVALTHDRAGLLRPGLPFVKSIDGVAAGDWLRAAASVSADGAPHFVRRNAMELAPWATFIRGELGRNAGGSIDVELVNDARDRSETLSLAIASRLPAVFPRARPTGWKRLSGGIGFLRIADMSDEPAFLDLLSTAIAALADAPGLVIDVRGNPGGSRDALRMLYPLLCDEKAGPRVVNVAKYRLRPGDERGQPEGNLENRSLFPLSSKRWRPDERAAIERFARGFKPEWSPPEADFSDWHYMVLGPARGESARPFAGPVVVLMDEGCFSAADIFLGAIKGLPRVTLMGRPSGGGSGRAESVTLPESGLRVMMSSMASFRPDGRLYDGRGVEPDVLHGRGMDDILDKSDSMLDAAVKLLRDGDRK